MKILYRISESTNSQHAAARTWQVKLPNATKQNCLLNVMDCFPKSEIIIFVDSITEETFEWLKNLEALHDRVSLKKIQAGSDAKSFRELLNEVLSYSDNSEIVLFQEDDYLYLPGSEQALIDALEYSHYATCYLHPDKFWEPSKGGNPSTPQENISEHTQVIKTNTHFWMLTNSTTNTFATTVGVIKEDIDEWMWGTSDLINTKDYAIFCKLREKGRSLVQPIPSLATHCLRGFEAPILGTGITSWKDVWPLRFTEEPIILPVSPEKP